MTTTDTRTVLLVDDEPSNLRLLQMLLKAEGYSTLLAENGAEALALTEKQKPDIILLDIMMPDMDGFEVARRLKAGPDTRNIPIIMVTSLGDRGSRLKALEMGAEEFLNKPVDRAELSVRVKNLLRLKEYSDFLADHNHRLEDQVAARTAQLSESYREAIYIMTSAAEHKDEDTGLHVSHQLLLPRAGGIYGYGYGVCRLHLLCQPDARHRQDRHPGPYPAQIWLVPAGRMDDHENPFRTR
jgi:putative two-component system response regulator